MLLCRYSSLMYKSGNPRTMYYNYYNITINSCACITYLLFNAVTKSKAVGVRFSSGAAALFATAAAVIHYVGDLSLCNIAQYTLDTSCNCYYYLFYYRARLFEFYFIRSENEKKNRTNTTGKIKMRPTINRSRRKQSPTSREREFSYFPAAVS